MRAVSTRARWRRAVGWVCLLGLSGAAAAACDDPLDDAVLRELGSPVVGGAETFDRPEVGTIRVGGGMCTATLVASDVLVSAAHCVGYRSTSGAGNYGSFTIKRSASEPAQAFTIDRYRSFGSVGADDVALLHLSRAVPADLARPAALGMAHPPAGEPLTLYGYGCVRRNTSLGSGVKRALALRQGDGSTNLCPGDSGGPVIQNATGAVLRVNSAYLLDGTGRDIFGDVPRNHARLVEQIRAWGSTPGDGTPGGGGGGGGVPDAGSGGGGGSGGGTPCGAWTGYTIFTCNRDRTSRARCVDGRLEREACAHGCESRPVGVDDVCRAAPGGSGEACGRYEGWTIWTCIDASTRVRCLGGALQRETCAGGCEGRPVGVDDVCRGGSGGGSDAGTPGGGGGGSDAGAGADAGATPPGDVVWSTWAAQHARANAAWGRQLTDIVQHLPLSYGDTYADADLITYGHETTHGINAHLRNRFNTTGRAANAFYVLGDRWVLVAEPNMRKSAVAAFVPASLRGSRYSLYVAGSSAWDDRPLYLFDEWVAYTNGSEVALGLYRDGLWRYGWRGAFDGTIEFVAYALAVGMAVEARDPAYFRDYGQFRAFLAWNARRAMELFRAGAGLEPFRFATQDAYYRALRESPDAEAMREFARRTYGRAWASEVLGLAP